MQYFTFALRSCGFLKVFDPVSYVPHYWSVCAHRLCANCGGCGQCHLYVYTVDHLSTQQIKNEAMTTRWEEFSTMKGLKPCNMSFKCTVCSIF